MKRRIPAIIAALTFSAALAIAADAPVAKDNNSKSGNTEKATCCQLPSCPMSTAGACPMLNGGTCPASADGSCAMLNGGTCPLAQAGDTNATAAQSKKIRKPKPAASGACCASDACGNSATATVKGKYSCSSQKKAPASAQPDSNR